MNYRAPLTSLLGDEQEVVFLAALHQQITAVDKVGNSNRLVKLRKFLFVKAYAAALILTVIVLLLSLGARWLSRRFTQNNLS